MDGEGKGEDCMEVVRAHARKCVMLPYPRLTKIQPLAQKYAYAPGERPIHGPTAPQPK